MGVNINGTGRLHIMFGVRDEQGQDTWAVYSADWTLIGFVRLFGLRCYLPTCYTSEDVEIPFEHTLGGAAESVYRCWQQDQLNTGS